MSVDARKILQPQNPSVLELIANRVKTLKDGGRIDDGHRLDLILPGGGVGAYFAAGQTEKGFEIYDKYINNKKFISFSRLVGEKPVINVEYLTHTVMRDLVELDCGKLINNDLFHPYVTDATTGELVDLSKRYGKNGFQIKDQVLEAILLSALTPIFGGLPREGPGGRFYIDGGLAAHGIPWQPVIEDQTEQKATHVLVLLPRPEEYYGQKHKSSIIDKIGALIYRRQKHPLLADLTRNYERNYLKMVRRIKNAAQNSEFSPKTEIVQIPSYYRGLGLMTRKEKEISEAERAGYTTMDILLAPYFRNKN